MSSLTSQGLWILFAKSVGFGLNILLPLLVVRYLAQDQVGIYRQVFLVVGNAVTILPLGFSLSAYYFLNRDPEHRTSAVFHIILFNFVLGAFAFGTFFLFPSLLGNTFQNPKLTELSPLIGLLIWLWIFANFLEVVCLANQESRLAGVFIIVSQLTKTTLMVAVLVAITTVEALIYAAVIQATLQICILFVYLVRRFPRFWNSFDGRFLIRQIKYALPFGLAGLVYTIQADIHNYFVSYKFSPAEFAIYSIGCFQLPLIGILYESVGAVVIPRMSRLQAEGKKREMLLTAVSGSQRLSFAYFPLFVFLFVTAEAFITTLFTYDYAASVPIFRVNLLMLPMFSLLLDPVARAYPEVGGFLLKVRIALLVALAGVLAAFIGYLTTFEIISLVVGAFFLEKLASTWKSLKMLDAKPNDLYLFKNVLKIAFASMSAGIPLIAICILAKSLLLTFCFEFWHFTLSFVSFERGAQFMAGCTFLGICVFLYGLSFLMIANQIGVIEDDDKERVYGFVQKIYSSLLRRSKLD